MSRVRTHFCTLVARVNCGVSCPRKYGLKGTIPALTNNRLGSSCTSGALGTTVWPRLPKNESQRRLISAVSMVESSGGSVGAGGSGRGQPEAPHSGATDPRRARLHRLAPTLSRRSTTCIVLRLADAVVRV